MLVYQRVMGSNGFQWISIDLTCWSIWLAEMCTCQNWWSSITKVTEQNLNGILPAGSLSTTKRSKEALGIYPQWIMNLNPQNGWLLFFLIFFGAKSRHLRHGARFGVVVMLESVPWNKIHGVNSAMEFLSAENHSPLSIHSSHKGTCFFW